MTKNWNNNILFVKGFYKHRTKSSRKRVFMVNKNTSDIFQYQYVDLL